jgi:hypothetical protein
MTLKIPRTTFPAHSHLTSLRRPTFLMPPKSESVEHTSGGHRTPPNPPPERKTGLSMSDFHYQGPLEDISTSAATSGMRRSDTEQARVDLHEKRLRFTKQTPTDHESKICSPRDRRAALGVYDEAIEKIRNTNYLEIVPEADYKIRVILGITKAHASATVFQKKEQHLSPIEPQYAEPRIEWNEDAFSYHATWRLQEWRDDGWPDRFPDKAIQKERDMDGDPRAWYDQDWSEINGLS